ncbi:hypothetical protein [Dactylosporangium salmoneum]|uniref:Uncharacterized protein n=1 Tax=Dactylosporangium salmoneum TaxID=53361 RepID=A0ABP5SV71_9ACTN
MFPQTTLEDLSKNTRQRQIGGHGLLGPEGCVEWMFELLERRAGSNITTRESLGIYGLLSNFTHPTLHVTREMREFVQDGDHIVSVHEVDLQFVERQARLAVSVFYNTMAYVSSYFGWPRAPHDELTRRIDAVMPGMFQT